LRGARQIGKTYSVLEFGKSYFNGKIHTIDFEKYPELCKVFQKDLSALRILSEIEIFLQKKIIIKEDLLFFDEIQNCKNALSSLRYFYEDFPELHLIAAGSLIEFALQDISFPVGRVQTLEMYPMNFYEYLLACGQVINAEAIMAAPNNNSKYLHNTLINELRNYFFIGGMPEAVKEYITTGKIISALEVQKDLLSTFRQDFSKYAGRSDKKCLDDILIATAQNIGNQIKYVKLSDGYSIPTIKKSFQLLLDAKIITKIRSTNLIGLPLGAGASNKKFKSLFVDIGLMRQSSGLDVSKEYVMEDLLSIYRGALAEQFVGQELLSTGISEIYYWARDRKNSNAEIDYLISQNNEIYPIEVKSGPAGKLKSLHLLLSAFPKIKNSYVFSTGEYSSIPDQKITFPPLYYAYSFAS